MNNGLLEHLKENIWEIYAERIKEEEERQPLKEGGKINE